MTIDEKLHEFKGIIPTLLKNLQDGSVPVIRHYEGVSGVEQIFDDILLTCQRLSLPDNELLIISSGHDLIRLLPDHDKKFINKRIRRGIPARMLAPKNTISQRIFASNNSQLRQTLFFDNKKHPFNIEIDIYDDKIALMNLNEPGITGTVIQNRNIASSMKSMFNMLWLSKKTPTPLSPQPSKLA